MIKEIFAIVLLSIKIFAGFPDTSRISIILNNSKIKLKKDEIKKLGLKNNIKITFYRHLNINYIDFYSLSRNDITNSYKVYKNQNHVLDHSSYIDKLKVINILNESYKKGFIKGLTKEDLTKINKTIRASLVIFYLPENCKISKTMYNYMIYNGKYLYAKDDKEIKLKDIQSHWYAFENYRKFVYHNKCPEIK